MRRIAGVLQGNKGGGHATQPQRMRLSSEAMTCPAYQGSRKGRQDHTDMNFQM
jgi:hypothetical protein